MIRVVEIPNILNNEGRREKILSFNRDLSVLEYLKASSFNYEGCRVIVTGKKIHDLNIKLDNDDEILILPDIKDPVTLIVNAFQALWALAVAHPFIAAATVLSVGYGIYSYVSAPRAPDFNFSGGNGIDESSPTYSWDGIHTIQEVGVPVAIVFGEHRVGGNIINQFVSTDGDLSYLNLLIALCEGEIESISDIKINGNPIANYDGITVDSRTGTNTDSVVANFEDLHTIYPVSNVQLKKNNSYVYTTINNDVEAFELYLNLASGLYSQSDTDGSINPWEVSYRVEYKLTTAGAYTDLGITTISVKSRSAVRRIFRKEGLAKGKYDIRITRTSDDSDFRHVGDLFLYQVDEIKTDDIQYNNTAKVGIKALATDQLSGSTPNVTFLVKGTKVLIPRVMNGGAEVAWQDYYWDPDDEVYKLFSDGTFLSWDGTTYVRRYSANPTWCMYELLTNSRFGLGEFMNTSQMRLADFLEMSRYCEEKIDDGEGGFEKRFRMDVVIDSAAKSLDIIAQLATVFRAMPFYSGGLIKIKIDKPDTPVQLFGMGNIIEDSFTQAWKSYKEQYNHIEVQFLNKEKDYEQDTIAIIDEAAIAANEPIRKKAVRVFTTKTSYALREGRFALLASKHVNRTISFRAGIDAIALQAGDIFEFSHDVPQWGFSGRVVSGTFSSVTLDQPVVIESGKTYKVKVRFAGDTIEERTVTNSAGSHSTLNVTPSFNNQPADFDVYAFGESNKVVKPFRAVSLQRINNFEVSINGIEYNENVYNDSAVVIPRDNYSALDPNTPDVEDIVVSERATRLNDGTIEDIIDLYWNNPNVSALQLKKFAKVRIFISADNGVSWEYRGETTRKTFTLQGGIFVGNTYIIAFVSVSDRGEENAIALSPQETITTTGKNEPPTDVASLDVSQNGDRLRFAWPTVVDNDLARYVIKKGSDWATGTIIAEKVDVTEFEIPVGEIGPQTYMVKAIDTSGNESVNPAIDEIEVEPPPDMNFTNEIDPWQFNREYKLTNVVLIPRTHYSPLYERDVFALKTTELITDLAASWEELQGIDPEAGVTFEASGSIEQVEPYDLLTLFEFNIISDLLIKNVSGGSITLQVSTSEDNLTYSAFANVNSGTKYRARYLKFKYNLATSDTSNGVEFYAGTIFINAPINKVFAWRDVLVATAGTFIKFRDDFVQKPRIRSLHINNGVRGFIEVISMDATGMTVKVRDPETAAYMNTAEIDGEVVGA